MQNKPNMSIQQKSTVSLQPVHEIFEYVIPLLQRNINQTHIKEIVDDQIQEFDKWQCFSILQAVTVAKVREGKTYILDGQHRICAFKALDNAGYPINEVMIPVVAYDVFDEIEMLGYFNRINKNMPIHPLELEPEFADYGKVIIENMEKTFTGYLKHDSKNSRCPHINMNDFKKNLAGRTIGDKLKAVGVDAKTFWMKIMEFNNFVKNNIKASHQLCAMMQKRMTDCEVKAQKLGCNVCYLGVWRRFEWLDFALDSLCENKAFANISLACETKIRQLIPACVRVQVWKKVNPNQGDMGVCFTCCNDLYYSDAECGHIKAHALGGTDTVDNLMPVCKTCNKDMGIMNLFDYKNMIEAMSR